jgi:competence protein ComEC
VAFMLTGDAPIGIEDYIAASYGELIQSDVLKLGHHGSKTSSGEVFLKTVLPTYAIVSAGRDNRYGHPHAEVIDRAKAVGATILSTTESGTIIFKSDGKRVWVEE